MQRLIAIAAATIASAAGAALAVDTTGAAGDDRPIATTQASAHDAHLHAVHGSADDDDDEFRAVLRDPAGTVVGTVRFTIDHHSTKVRAVLRPNPYVVAGEFHGFHVHANDDQANGAGCVADASQPSSTWFVAVDGHWAQPGQTHGDHTGDLPSPLVQADRTALLVATTDRIDPGALEGRAVILHAGPDNFGNVPIGLGDDQYQPNSPAATDKTQKTGNAGDRVACGLVHRDD
jgi:Cu-Zn family superoxide dismutase